MGRIICTQDPEAAAARDASFLGRATRELEVPPFPPLGDGLFLTGAPLAGSLGLQAKVRGESGEAALLDDAVGQGFVLLVRGSAPPKLSARARSVRDAQACRVAQLDAHFDHTGAYAAWLDAHELDAVLVRPDHVVLGAAAGATAASDLLEALGAQLAGSG